MYLLNSAQYGYWSSAHRCVTPPKWSKNVPMCLRNLPNEFGAWGPNKSWDIDLPTPPCIWSTWPRFWALSLWPWVCQHLPSSLKLFYVSQKPPNEFGAWGPRSWDIDLPTPPCICSIWPNVWALVFCPQEWQNLPSGLKCSYVFQELPK